MKCLLSRWFLLTRNFLQACSFFWIRWFFCTLLFMGASHDAFADSLQAIADRDSMGVDETLNFKLVYNGQRASGDPDLTSLTQQFNVLSNQKSNQISIVPGSVSTSTEWHFTLSPRSTGQLLIPPFTVDGQHSQPFTITVREATKDPVVGAEDVFLEAHVDKPDIFVQEQFLVTLRLYYDRSIGADEQPLSIDNARVETLPSTEYQKTIGQKQYGVTEYRYAVFADASGTITIPSQDRTVSPTDARRFNLGLSSDKLYKIKSKELKVTIAPRPVQYPTNTVWLPAKEVTIEELWSQTPTTVKVGEPITRTIRVKAVGAAAESIPPIFQESTTADFKFYQDKHRLDKQLSERGVIGTRTESVAIVPNRNGDLLLPEVKVTWWNTERKQVEVATLPARTIHATGNAPATTTPAGTNDLILPTLATPSTAPAEVKEPWSWIIVAGLSLLGNIVLVTTLVLRRPSSPAQINIVNEKNTTTRELFKRVQKSCDAQQAELVRNTILEWSKHQWGAQVNSLTKVAELSGNEKLITQLRRLDSALYGGIDRERGDAINYAELKTQLGALNNQPKHGTAIDRGQLKPLYATQ